jgi:hypothetical protein
MEGWGWPMYLKFCELKDYLLVVGASAVYI